MPSTVAAWKVPTIPGPAGIITPTTSTPRTVKAWTSERRRSKARARMLIPQAFRHQ
jgi:hypothetical protein